MRAAIAGLVCAWLTLAATVSVGCGGAPSAPSVVQVAGHWTGTAKISSVIGGDCMYPSYAALIGYEIPFQLDLQQSGSVLSSSDGSGCSASGSIDGNRFTLNGDARTCSADSGLSFVICANGTAIDIHPMSHVTTGVVSGNSMTGEWTQIDAIYAFGKPTLLDNLTVTVTFSATRN